MTKLKGCIGKVYCPKCAIKIHRIIIAELMNWSQSLVSASDNFKNRLLRYKDNVRR